MNVYIDHLFNKLADEARGIPDRKYFGNIAKDIKPGDIVDYVRQRHLAYRRGPHYDLRFGKNKQTGLHSWATSFDYPEPGGKINVIQMPTHKFDYLNWSGEIPRGQYGGGKVSVLDQGKIIITDIKPDEVHFTVASDKSQKRFVLVKGKDADKQWTMIRASNKKDLEIEKPKLKSIPMEEVGTYLKGLSSEAVGQPKIDGALNFLQLQRKPELLSPRLSKTTGTPIVQTEKFFGGRPEIDLPSDWKNTVLMTEIYGERKGRAIPPQELGGILNSTIENSLKKQREEGIKLKAMVFDIARRKGKEVDREGVPYAQRRAMLEQVMKYLPKDKFTLPEQATGKEDIQKLFREVQHGRHTLTNEGLIVHEKGEQPVKLKLTNEDDVYVKDIFPGYGKYDGHGAGGFTYSLTPNGPAVGKVGTGFSDALRKAMHEHPEDFINTVARVRSQGKFPSQALRAPSLIAMHQG